MKANTQLVRTSTRGRWLTGASAVAVLGCVGAVGTVAAASAGYHGSTKGTGTASVVDHDDPRSVVLAYVDAKTHGRLGEMRGLVSPATKNPALNDNLLDRGFGRRDAELTDLVVHRVRPDFTGKPGNMYVPVDFTLRGIGHSTGFVDGPTVWGYVLTKSSPERGWLIIDEGFD